MKLFGISSRDSGMDAMFYIQASTKQQASFIFDFLATGCMRIASLLNL